MLPSPPHYSVDLCRIICRVCGDTWALYSLTCCVNNKINKYKFMLSRNQTNKVDSVSFKLNV